MPSPSGPRKISDSEPSQRHRNQTSHTEVIVMDPSEDDEVQGQKQGQDRAHRQQSKSGACLPSIGHPGLLSSPRKPSPPHTTPAKERQSREPQVAPPGASVAEESRGRCVSLPLLGVPSFVYVGGARLDVAHVPSRSGPSEEGKVAA